MKSIQKAVGVILVLIMCSCSQGDMDTTISPTHQGPDSEVTTRNSSGGSSYGVPQYSHNSLIVRYAATVTPSQKIYLRSLHGVYDFEVCKLCPDGRIEKWMFDMIIQIEPKKHAIETITGEDVEVDYEFEWESEIDGVEVGSSDDLSYVPLIVSSNVGPTIGVLDTGFDQLFPFWYDEYGNPEPMLYNATGTAEEDELSGYDFVDNDNNPFDDNPGKHGSVVAYEIHEILKNAMVPHQILPVKICNEAGKTSYFHLLCGANYVLPRSQVVQMSLGWYDDGFGDFDHTILQALIEEHGDVVVVASAGNDNKNNDTQHHYPSSYPTDNMIAVAATNEDGSNKAGFSNYGLNSVDFFAAGQHVPFYTYEYEPILYGVSGTSFAAPQIAAQAAMHIFIGGGILEPIDIVNMINFYGLPIEEGTFDNLVHYNKYYPMMLE